MLNNAVRIALNIISINKPIRKVYIVSRSIGKNYAMITFVIIFMMSVKSQKRQNWKKNEKKKIHRMDTVKQSIFYRIQSVIIIFCVNDLFADSTRMKNIPASSAMFFKIIWCEEMSISLQSRILPIVSYRDNFVE